jgi:hypothetical protein
MSEPASAAIRSAKGTVRGSGVALTCSHGVGWQACSVDYSVVQRRHGLSTSKGDSSSNRVMGTILHSPCGGWRCTGENKVGPVHVAS